MLIFLFSLYIGDHTEEDPEKYSFLGDYIRKTTSFTFPSLKPESRVIFFEYISSLLRNPLEYIQRENISKIENNIQILDKILHVLSPELAKEFWKEYTRI